MRREPRWSTVIPVLVIAAQFLLSFEYYLREKYDPLNWEIVILVFSTAFINPIPSLGAVVIRRLQIIILAWMLLINLLFTFKYFARSSAMLHLSAVSLTIFIASISMLLISWGRLKDRRLTMAIVVNALAAILICYLRELWGEMNAVGSMHETDSHSTLFVRIMFNALYLATVVRLIFWAVEERNKLYFLASIFCLLLWAVVRYIDLFKNYLTTALIFAMAALVLIAMNKLWEKKYEK